GAAADDAAKLLAQAPDAWRLRARVVVVPDRGRAARQPPDDQSEPALKLIIIVAVEKIVLAVVLVVEHRLGGSEPRLDHSALGAALGRCTIGVAAPAEPSIGEIGFALPDALVDHHLQPRSIGAGFRAENPVSRAPFGILRRNTLSFERRAIGGVASA